MVDRGGLWFRTAAVAITAVLAVGGGAIAAPSGPSSAARFGSGNPGLSDAEPSASAADTTSGGGGEVTVFTLWGGSEAGIFQTVVDGFTKDSGVAVTVESQRDFLPVLTTRVASGNPPDVAIIPRPGVMADLARQDQLKSLDSLGVTGMPDNFSQAWLDLGSVDGTLYGIPVEASSKSTFWYKPASFAELGIEPPKSWDEFKAILDKYVAAGQTPLAVGGKDTWTLTDWFENIYVRSAGPDKYSQLFSGELPFNDPSVLQALTLMTDVISNDSYVAGGREGVLGTTFVDGIGRVFGQNADAQMYFEGGFVGGLAINDVNTSLVPGKDIAFFTFSQIDPQYDDPLIGGGSIAVAFHDTPAVRQLMAYLASKTAADSWTPTGKISPNKNGTTEGYPTELVKAEAAQLVGAKVFRFDGSDLLPGTLGEAWGSTLQGVVNDPSTISQAMDDFQSQAEGQFTP